MKAKLIDYGHCYAIELEAETLQEAQAITNCATNCTKECRGTEGYATAEGSFHLSHWFGKRKNSTTSIVNREKAK